MTSIYGVKLTHKKTGYRSFRGGFKSWNRAEKYAKYSKRHGFFAKVIRQD